MSRYDSSTGLGLSETWFGFNNTDGSFFSLGVYGPTNSDSMYRQYTGILSANRWYHTVGVYDGGTTPDSIKLYIDGA
jgi:hypothetical protein